MYINVYVTNDLKNSCFGNSKLHLGGHQCVDQKLPQKKS